MFKEQCALWVLFAAWPAAADRLQLSDIKSGSAAHRRCKQNTILRGPSTLGPAYNEFGYNEHTAVTSTFLCIKIIDYYVKKFGYNEHSLITSSFFCMFLFVVSGI